MNVESVTKRDNTEETKPLSLIISEWVEDSVGWFDASKEMYRDLRIETREGKTHARKVMQRLVDSKKLTRKQGKNGVFRRIVEEVDEIDWKNANPNNIIPLKWVFHLENYVHIYAKNIIVVAGSPNSGKTGLLLNFIHDNQDLYPDQPLSYFSSEMGPEEMKLRLSKFPAEFDWHFKAFNRSSNFADVINPNGINVVDFLEVTDTFYKVGEEITDIFNILDKGIAVIAIQKKKAFKNFKGQKIEVELGRGAEFSLEKPRLYLSLDTGKCKIIKGKNWANPKVNPNGMEFTFKLVDGYKFITTQTSTIKQSNFNDEPFEGGDY
jgi:hypothetical protein